ncbi:calcium permeable stress-gated cation channel 1 isoform X2 [Latimeria chalumnae]|uniref:calcium permeable stress-gated cation channel 1 isoform X2 n=1 Tax=Latimeria chalumnae TaxID=7897 RepID=UPI00313E64C1
MTDSYVATLPRSDQEVSFGVLGFLDSLGVTNETEEHCYSARSRSTVLQGLPFGGIPTVLAINFILWLVLLLIFSCLRKAAWDYGRLALLMDNDSQLSRGQSSSYDLTSLFYGEQSEKEKSPSDSSPSELETKDLGFCSWMNTIYHMKDEEIQAKCGIDAIIYLSFQRHILVLLGIICVISVSVILPVNFSGDLLGDSPKHFGRTTIANVPIKDRLLWLHSIFALLYFVATVLCMVHHSMQFEYKEHEKVARTLMITHLPREISDPSMLTKHFHEAYPSCTIMDVQFCFDVRKLMKLDNERRKAMKGRLYFTSKAQKEGKIMIKTHPCAQIFCCDACGFEKVDAEQYYSELEEKLTDEFNAERNRITLKRLEIAFVTFQDDRMTAVIVKDYSRTRCRRHPQQSSITTVIQSHQWGVRYAPSPSDIIWENLSVHGTAWWLRCIAVNICVFVLLFFLTTPAIIVNTMDKFNVTRPVESLKNPIVTQFFPTLLLWAFSVLLPFIVYYSAFLECHWTRSSENQITMHKCYFFLVFMVIILPSLGLTSLDVFFRWLFDIHFLDEADIKFQCVFLPDNGAFFINYVITSSLIGTAMELLRIPGLIVYATRLCFAKSEAERLHVKRNQAYEFQFGLEYAWTMCIFAVVMTYSITCPVIVPFGLLYMLLKHLVDRYNIYYAYIPTKLSQRIHLAAISQVIVAPILCMFWLLFFSVLRLGPTRPITLFTFVALLVCILFSFFGACWKRLQPAKPNSYQMADQQSEGVFSDNERSSVSSTINSNVFVATVLQEPELGLTPAASPAHQSYGAMENRMDTPKLEEDKGERQIQSFETELENQQYDYSTGPLVDSEARFH